MQSAIAAANTPYETVHKATQHAADFIEDNFNMAANAASEATQHAVGQTARAARSND